MHDDGYDGRKLATPFCDCNAKPCSATHAATKPVEKDAPPQCIVNHHSISHFKQVICWPGLLANGFGSWLSYSGVVRILFPEQLGAVAERLCRRHIIHSVSILKVSVCAAGVCPGIHCRFSDSSTFFSG